MTKRKLIAQLRECAQDMDHKPVCLYNNKYFEAQAFARKHKRGFEHERFFLYHVPGTILLLLLLADMLEAE